MDHNKAFVSRLFDRLLAGDVAMLSNPRTADLEIETKQNQAHNNNLCNQIIYRS